jgi:hypothetical protein
MSSSFTLYPGSPLRRASISKSDSASSYPPQQNVFDVNDSLPDTLPQSSISGSYAITQYHILNNRRHVLAKDTANYITLWDITTGELLENFGSHEHLTLEQKSTDLFELAAIPNWFSIQTKLGCLEIVLDPSNCFSADIHATDAGFSFASLDEKVNMGYLMIQALFRDWLTKRTQYIESMRRKPSRSDTDSTSSEDEEDATNNVPSITEETQPETTTETPANSEDQSDHDMKPETSESKTENPEPEDPMEEDTPIFNPIRFELPETTPVIIHNEKTNATTPPIKKCIGDWSGKDLDIIPKWIVDVLVRGLVDVKITPQKIVFYLESMDEAVPNLNHTSSRLNASRLLRVNKIATHVITQLKFKLPTRQQFELMKEEYEKQKSVSSVDQNGGTTVTKSDVKEDQKPKQQTSTATSGLRDLFFKKSTSTSTTTTTKKQDVPPTQQEEEEEEDSPVKPEEYLEILCNGKILEPLHTLGIANKFFRDPNSSTIKLHYRRRYPVNIEDK